MKNQNGSARLRTGATDGQAKIVVILLALAVVFGVGYGVVRKKMSIPPQTEKTEQNAVVKEEVQAVFKEGDGTWRIVGVLRSSGLNDEEKQILGLSFSDFQVTNFTTLNAKLAGVDGYFLEVEDFDEGKYLGRCVKLVGSVTKEKRLDGFYVNNGVVVPRDVEMLPYEKCNPYEDPALAGFKQAVDGGRLKIVQGVIEFSKRPAPDIGYDYEIVLDDPIKNSDGFLVRIVDIIPDSNSVWIKLNENIGKELKLEGYFAGGYAEGIVFTVLDVK